MYIIQAQLYPGNQRIIIVCFYQIHVPDKVWLPPTYAGRIKLRAQLPRTSTFLAAVEQHAEDTSSRNCIPGHRAVAVEKTPLLNVLFFRRGACILHKMAESSNSSAPSGQPQNAVPKPPPKAQNPALKMMGAFALYVFDNHLC